MVSPHILPPRTLRRLCPSYTPRVVHRSITCEYLVSVSLGNQVTENHRRESAQSPPSHSEGMKAAPLAFGDPLTSVRVSLTKEWLDAAVSAVGR